MSLEGAEGRHPDTGEWEGKTEAEVGVRYLQPSNTTDCCHVGNWKRWDCLRHLDRAPPANPFICPNSSGLSSLAISAEQNHKATSQECASQSAHDSALTLT